MNSVYQLICSTGVRYAGRNPKHRLLQLGNTIQPGLADDK